MVHTAQFELVTGLFIHDLEGDFAPHVGKQVAVVIDGSTPQVTTLVQSLRDWERGGSQIIFADRIVVPRFRPLMCASVLDEHWERIGPLNAHAVAA